MPQPTVSLNGSEYTPRQIAEMGRDEFFDFVRRWRGAGKRPSIPLSYRLGGPSIPKNQWGYYALLLKVLDQIFTSFDNDADEDSFEELLAELREDQARCNQGARTFVDDDDDTEDDSDEDDSDEDDDDGEDEDDASPILVPVEPPKKGLAKPAKTAKPEPVVPKHIGPIQPGMTKAEIEKWCKDTADARAAVDYDFLITFKVKRNATYSIERLAMLFAAVKDVPEQPFEDEGYITLPMQLYCADKRLNPTVNPSQWAIDFSSTRLQPKELANLLFALVNIKFRVEIAFVINTDGYDPRFVPMIAKVLRGASIASSIVPRDRADFEQGNFGSQDLLLPKKITKFLQDDYMILEYGNNRFFTTEDIDVRSVPRRQKALDKNLSYIVSSRRYSWPFSTHAIFDELNSMGYIMDDSPSWQMTNHTGLMYFRGTVPPPNGKVYEQGKALSMFEGKGLSKSKSKEIASKNRYVIYGDAVIDYSKLLDTDVKEFARAWVETLLKDVKKRHTTHKENLEKAHAQVRKETKNLAETTILLNSVSGNPRLQFEQIVDKLRSLEMVEAVQPRYKSLMVDLKPIHYTSSAGKKEEKFLGKYRLGIGLGFESISIENSQAYKRCHPHILNAAPCLGGYRQLLNDAVLNTDVYQLVLVMIEFLSNVNENDHTAMDYFKEFKKTPGSNTVRSLITFNGEIQRRNDDDEDNDDDD